MIAEVGRGLKSSERRLPGSILLRVVIILATTGAGALWMIHKGPGGLLSAEVRYPLLPKPGRGHAFSRSLPGAQRLQVVELDGEFGQA